MGSLSTCLRKAGKALNTTDAAAIREIYNDYLADKMPASKAADKALTDYIEVLDLQRREVLAVAAKAGETTPSTNLLYSADSKPPTMIRAISIVEELYNIKGFIEGMDKKKTIKDLANILTARTKRQNRGRSLAAPTARNKDIISSVIALETQEAMKQTGHAGHWYSQVLVDAMNIVSTFYPEINTDANARTAFLLGMAVTSNGMTVSENSKWAVKVYASYKRTGKFPDFGTGKEEAAMKKAFTLANELVNTWGMETFTSFLNTKFTVKELKGLGLDVNGENADTEVYGSAIFGPKIGQAFFQNLSGNFTPLTMDRWWMRTWGRMAGNLAAGGLKGATRQLENFRALVGKNSALVDAAGFNTEQVMTNDKAAVRLATKLHKAYAAGGFKEKTAFNKAAKSLDARVHDPVVAPRNGTERAWIREVVAEAQRKLEEKGISVDTASMQALLWYPEKEFYLQNGVGNERSKPTDYAKELGKIARRKRIPQGAIDAAVTAGRGRTARAVGAADERSKQTARGPALAAKERTGLIQNAAIRALRELPVVYVGRPAKGAAKSVGDASVLVIHKLAMKAKNKLEGAKMDAPIYLQLESSPEAAKLFASLEPDASYTVEEYELMQLYISQDRKSAFAIDKDQVVASLNLGTAGQLLAESQGTTEKKGVLYRLEDEVGTTPEEQSVARLNHILEAEAKTRGPVSKALDYVKDLIDKNNSLAALNIKLVPRRYLKDFILNDAVKMPSLGEYLRNAKRMDGRANQLMEHADELGVRWSRFVRTDKNAGRLLGELMHFSTIKGVDPSKPYKSLKDRSKMDAAERTIDDSRRRAWSTLNRHWNTMPAEGKAVYTGIRDAYAAHRKMVETALSDKIAQSAADSNVKKSLLSELRKQFEAGRVAGPYFPLGRFGQLWASAKDSDGKTIAFSKFEKPSEQREWVRNARISGLEVDSGKDMEVGDVVRQIDPDFVAKVTGMVAGLDKTLADEVWQMYLQNMPEMSMRKQFLHRKNRLGYSANALRTFGKSMFFGSHQIAKLEHSYRLESNLAAMSKEVRALEKAEDPDKKYAHAVHADMVTRHALAMNPNSSAWAANATAFGFAWYLGATAAAALVNLSQTAIVGLPVLSAEFSALGATTELSKASSLWAISRGNIEDRLRGPERAAMDEARKVGIFDKTQGHDLASMADGSTDVGGLGKTSKKVISYLFHKAEQANREVTFLAAYRLAIKAGLSQDAAILKAEDLVWDSHFDYEATNRPPIMQGGVARVALLFKQYSMNMAYRMGRDLRDSTTFQSLQPGERKKAAQRLVGMLAMTELFSGVTGLPLVSGTAAMVAAMFGDDDDPIDPMVELRIQLAEMYGPEVATWIMKGPVDDLTGMTISSRVSLANLFWRDASAGATTADKFAHYTKEALGPVYGMGADWAVAADLTRRGLGKRALEKITPKALKDALKSFRYLEEGVQNLRGDIIIEPEDITLEQAAVQMFGFSPAEITLQQDQLRATGDYARKVETRRQNLMRRYATASRLQDKAELKQVSEEMLKFNRAHPGNPVGAKSLIAGAKARARYSSRAVRGLVLKKKQSHLHRQMDFTTERENEE